MVNDKPRKNRVKLDRPFRWQKPKPTSEDTEAPKRVQGLLDCPSYRQADQDIDFLNGDNARLVRLGLDYLKPDLGLAEHGVFHTIVVFGSMRIIEPSAAQQCVDERRTGVGNGTRPIQTRVRPCASPIDILPPTSGASAAASISPQTWSVSRVLPCYTHRSPVAQSHWSGRERR